MPKGKFRIFDAQGDDDLIKNYSFKVNGYNFLEPRFYFSRKNKHTDRDKSDWDGTDHHGQIVAPGTYLMHIEATNWISGEYSYDMAPIVVGVYK